MTPKQTKRLHDLEAEIERLKEELKIMDRVDSSAEDRLSSQEAKLKELEGEVARTASRSYGANDRLDHCEKRDKDATEQRIEIREWITDSEKAIKSLEETVRSQNTALAGDRNSMCSRLQRLEDQQRLQIGYQVRDSNRLSSLETPNQSDCPHGFKCVEGKGHWFCGGKHFSECGNTCPKVGEDTKQNDINQAVALVYKALNILEGK